MAPREYLRLILFALEATACIAGFANQRRYKKTALWWMPIYLLVLTVSEIVSYMAAKYGFAQVNVVMAQLLMPFEFLFVFWFITRFLPFRKRNVFFCVLFLLYSGSVLAEQWYFKRQINVFRSFSYSVGNILLVFAIIAFFLNFSASEQILEFKKSAIFWMATGFIVFYLSTFPYYALFNYWWAEKIDFAYQYFYANMVANCFMYALFSYSFIRCR